MAISVPLEQVVFSVIFVSILVSGYYITYRYNLPDVERFRLMISYYGGLAMILLGYNIFINIRSNNRIEKNRIAYNTLENIQRNFLYPQKEALESYPEGFFLYASMNQDVDMHHLEPKSFDPAKRVEVEIYCSIRVFQAVEDFLSTAQYDITGMYVWINNFLMWFQSPILQYYWKILGFNLADDTREMTDRIIVKANELVELRKKKGSLTFQDYDAISKSFPVAYR